MSKVNIKIDGKNYIADSEKTLLDNILESGTYIPHLCHNRELESYGGCGLCLVMIEGMRKPLRACSVSVSEGMSVLTSTEEIEKSRKDTLALIMSDHRGDCKAPCYMACPTHQDVQGYVGLIACGRGKEALELIKKDNPLPASIGRVCPHPCEEKCRRNHLDGAVSICALKRFAAESNPDFIPEKAPENGKKIAVVGAGPAGLSCAYFLAIKGYMVEIFEAQEQGGGMLRYGIPAYRLPKNILQNEIDCLSAMGVQIHYSKKLGEDFTVSQLKADFDAVFIGIGAWKSMALGCDGDSLVGVLGGIDMLCKVAKGEESGVGKNVCVVGGGNTAIDAVRTAVRLGAENITLIYRRTEKEMPAEVEEIRDAKAEGVNFRFLASPLEVLGENGRVTGIKLQNMELGEPDASGRCSPKPIEGSVDIIPCDTVISAIGQRVNPLGLEGLALTKKNTLAVDENTFMTSLDGVFAAGDMINKGPDIAIKAIAGGKYAAAAIDCYLKGESVPPILPEYSVNNGFDAYVLEGAELLERTEISLCDPDTRKTGFSEVAKTFTEDEAVREASRCLECGCSAVYSCRLLPLARAYGAFSSPVKGFSQQYKKDISHPFIVRDNSKCILCAQCVRACREISKTENLGLFGRGFGALPVSAFDLPLGESKCVSCGACVNVCPTGALISVTPAVKNPPLPFEDEEYVCTLCENNCKFTKRSVLGKTVKMLPEKISESCSLGVFGLPAVDNIPENLNADKEKQIISRLTESIENYKGERKLITSLDEIKKLFVKQGV